MRWLLVIVILCLCCSTAPADARVERGAVLLDPTDQIRPELLTRALAALAAHPGARRDVIAIVDFAKPSRQARLFVVDLNSGAVEAYRAAHGRGSDSGQGERAERFSNAADSKASSLGAYVTAYRYLGKHGLSLALDGLDASNSNARARAIVLHSAPYMDDEFLAAHGRPGRSWGCFVVDPKVIDHVVARLERGALLYAGT